ncbi:MAG: hypothetical protein ACHQRJ_08180 [Alphaproteobacteria bacterium]
MPPFRDNASFGKRQEFAAIAELLRRNYDVYMTLVDDQQIDCVVRLDREPPIYVDIQIKARSRTAKNPGTFAAMEIRKPRHNFFFIFYSEAAETYWVMPSLDVTKMANRGKSGKAKGRYRILFTNTTTKGVVRPRPKWEPYRDNFDLIKGVTQNPIDWTREDSPMERPV